MKKIGIRIGVLAVVFIVAVLGFGYFVNKENAHITADIPEETLPNVSFRSGERTINTLRGYVDEMEIVSMRDTLTPVSNYKVRMSIGGGTEKVVALTYEVLSIDGTKSFYSKKEKKIEDEIILQFDENVSLSTERALKITLHTKEERDIHYYTRVADSQETDIGACLEFVKEFNEKNLEKTSAESLKDYLEPNSTANNATFQLTTIYSNIENVSWGELEPKLEGEISYDIKDLNKTFASIQLSYQVQCKGEENTREVYNVREFFRVRYDGKQMRLLDYERTANQLFDGAKNFLDAKGILLGIGPNDISYMKNAEGTMVSFVKEGELWSYAKETGEISRVFSMGATGDVDAGYLNEEYDINVIAVDSSGNTTFVVRGYMSSGVHEGQCGFILYHYDSEKNAVEEKFFISAKQSYSILKNDTERMLYYSHTNNLVYAFLNGTLYEIGVSGTKENILVEDMQAGEYVISNEGHIVGYRTTPNEIIVLNLETGKKYSVMAGEGESLRPLSFVGEDIIYGYIRQEAKGVTISGEEIEPMYKVEISDEKQVVQKTYEEENNFVVEVVEEDGFITLHRVTKEGNVYVPITENYITENKEKRAGNISLETYETELKKTQLRLVYANGIQNQQVKLLKPKQLVFKEMVTMEAENIDTTGKYYVYAHGKLQGVYSKAAYATKSADALSGVALTSNQQYVWEKRDYSFGYENEDIAAFKVQGDETSLEACMKKIAEYEGSSADIVSKMRTDESTFLVLGEAINGEGLDLSGCKVEDVFYLVSKGYPVIAMLDAEKAVLIVGCGRTAVVYLDPQSGERKSISIAEMNNLLAGSKNTLIGYVKEAE